MGASAGYTIAQLLIAIGRMYGNTYRPQAAAVVDTLHNCRKTAILRMKAANLSDKACRTAVRCNVEHYCRCGSKTPLLQHLFNCHVAY